VSFLLIWFKKEKERRVFSSKTSLEKGDSSCPFMQIWKEGSRSHKKGEEVFPGSGRCEKE